MSIIITANNDTKNKKTNLHRGKESKFCIRFLENCSLKSEEKQGT